MRILISSTPDVETSAEVDDPTLERLYASRPPAHDPADGIWLRANMVTTIDGAAQGEDGVSGGINNPADKRVYQALRSFADVVVVGAGTARAEEYGVADVPLVLVSRSGKVPEKLRGHAPGRVVMATVEASESLAETRALLGADNVWTLGSYALDLRSLRGRLAAAGFHEVLTEGGPHLLRDLMSVGAVDELCLTVVPRLVAGDRKRIAAGAGIDITADPVLLMEDEGTLLGRWTLSRPDHA